MFGGLNRPLVAALVAAAALVAPSAALACNSSVSAVNVYKECLPTGSGGKASGSGGGGGAGRVYVSKRTAAALKKAGADGKSLSNLVQGFGVRRLLQSHSSAAAAEPTAVGAAFDLGSGPTALLVVLAGTAILLVAATGFRSYKRR
ncbi:MAG TPA: hypothetical protein VKB43_14700 [Gaiellaceae bacterium]|nr:hypothetical protein [Gaiellaceae bacterium]